MKDVKVQALVDCDVWLCSDGYRVVLVPPTETPTSTNWYAFWEFDQRSMARDVAERFESMADEPDRPYRSRADAR